MGLVGTTAQGLSTIRSAGNEAHIIAQMNSLLETHTKAYFEYIGTSCWFASTLDWLANIFITCLVLLLIFIPFGEC